MANSIAADKKKITLTLPIDLLKRVDGQVAELDTTRVQFVVDALEAYLAGGVPPTPEDANSAKLEAISAKLDAMDAAHRLAVAGVLDAVKNQPIQVQPQQLPAPELNRENVAEWLKEHEPDAVALDAWGESTIKTAEKPQKGRLQRVIDALKG